MISLLLMGSGLPPVNQPFRARLAQILGIVSLIPRSLLAGNVQDRVGDDNQRADEAEYAGDGADDVDAEGGGGGVAEPVHGLGGDEDGDGHGELPADAGEAVEEGLATLLTIDCASH